MTQWPNGRRLRGGVHGTPVYTYDRLPGVSPVRVMRAPGGPAHGQPPGYAHTHDFLVLAYFERAGGSLRIADKVWPVRRGDAYVIAPGDIVPLGTRDNPVREARGWAVSFPADVLGAGTPGVFLSWRTHPLLLPFVRGTDSAGTHRVSVPPARQPEWSARFSALETELNRREDGYQEAVLSHLTLLLVAVARLAADVVGDLKLRREPLLAEVFGFIEEHYSEAISLRDVASAVSLTPGHLTTVVKRKTGRTVGEWITERRLAQARRLLVETDLAVEEVGRRVGYPDAGYFGRSFRRAHNTTPLRWRAAGR